MIIIEQINEIIMDNDNEIKANEVHNNDNKVKCHNDRDSNDYVSF